MRLCSGKKCQLLCFSLNSDNSSTCFDESMAMSRLFFMSVQNSNVHQSNKRQLYLFYCITTHNRNIIDSDKTPQKLFPYFSRNTSLPSSCQIINISMELISSIIIIFLLQDDANYPSNVCSLSSTEKSHQS